MISDLQEAKKCIELKHKGTDLYAYFYTNNIYTPILANPGSTKLVKR